MEEAAIGLAIQGPSDRKAAHTLETLPGYRVFSHETIRKHLLEVSSIPIRESVHQPVLFVEDTEGYFLLIRQMIGQYGIPMSIDSDRHMIFCSPNEKRSIEQELAGESVPLSQFGSALKDLGITHIKAMTPQAKGRIERLFQTLQDRWVVELRLRGIQTLEEANQVLPELIKEHNEKFAAAPLEPESPFVPLEPGQSLDLILCFRDQRMVGPGETISCRGKTYILDVPNSSPTIPAKTPVEVRKTPDGRLFVRYKGKRCALKEATRNKAATSPEKKKESSEKKSYKPGPDHPWRAYTPMNTKRLKQA